VGVTGRVELTIDELVLDGVDPTDERMRAELERQLLQQAVPGRAEQVAGAIAKAVDGATRAGRLDAAGLPKVTIP
jgi:hypothetical protein